MTPVSIKQLRPTVQQNQQELKKQSETKLDGSLKYCKLKVVTSKHEDCNLVFTNHRKEAEIFPLRTKNTL
jgi:hypothetical protein